MNTNEHEKQISICFKCPRPLYEVFMNLAKQDERSMAWTMRKAMQCYVDERTEESKHD